LVLNIILAYFSKIISERLALGKELLIAPEATVQGSATCIDYLCIRQNKVDEPNVEKIVGVLVYKSRTPQRRSQ
jgi:hypothetical protein